MPNRYTLHGGRVTGKMLWYSREFERVFGGRPHDNVDATAWALANAVALRPEKEEAVPDLQYYVVAVRKLYKDYVAQGSGITAEEYYRNRCVDRANAVIAEVIFPALGWTQPRVVGGKAAVCSVIRNLMTRMVLNLPQHSSYVGFSEAGMRAMDAFFRRAPNEVLIAAALNALADGNVPEKHQQEWAAFAAALEQTQGALDNLRNEQTLAR